MKRKYLRTGIITIIIVVCLPSSGLALNDEEVFSQFRFNFITPGARATALGGAFIGLADDATAVEANPAGLTTLITPEIAVEFKQIHYTTEQIYENLAPETNITRKEFEDFVESFPFISVVYPYKRFVLSLYRQELVNYKSSYQTSAVPIAITGTPYALYAIDAAVELTVTNYGIGVAAELFEGFSIAVSPRFSEMNMKAHTARFDGDLATDVLDPTDFSDDDLYAKDMIDDNDRTYSVNMGVLWKLHPRISFGAVYRSGPGFNVKKTLTRTYVPDLADFTVNIPDSFGVGMAFRATNFLTLTLDAIHIRYEDLLDDFDVQFGEGMYTRNNFTVNNATEVHFGVEYILTIAERFLALRAGVYNDPEHTIRFTGSTGNAFFDFLGKAQFPGDDEQIHMTGGLGFIVNDHFQVDTAANIAEKDTQLSLSAVYRF